MTKVEIVEKGNRFLFTEGYKNATIRKITSYLKISAKTFYKYFNSKEDFIIAVNEYRINFFNSLAKTCSDNSDDVIDYFFNFLKESEKISSFVSSEENIEELYTHYQETIPSYEKIFSTLAKNFISSVYNRAKEEGLADESIKKEAYFVLYANQFLEIRTERYYSQLNIKKEILNQMYYLFLKGLLNSKGVELLEKKRYNKFVSA